MLSQNLDVVIYEKDLELEYYNLISDKGIVAWDIETSGLNWKEDNIGICQLYCIGEPVAVVKIQNELPFYLIKLLADSQVKKIFHHAVFDLRFMCFKWNVLPQNIACTKIASKMLDSSRTEGHSLKLLLSEYLNVQIDKRLQLSNWSTNNLSNEQINYASNDVLYLFDLLSVLEEELLKINLIELAYSCYAHIPTRVRLDILGYKDIFTY